MRNPAQVGVSRAILHLVGHGLERDTILSQGELLLDSNEIKKFIAAHVHNSLRASQTIGARFTDQQGDVFTACQAVCSSPAQFVKQSHRIARRLGEIVRTDGRIAKGGLLVAMFTTDHGGASGGGPQHIAILKLDPSNAFGTKRIRHEGKIVVMLTKLKEVVPSAQEQLHQCAFIENPSDPDQFGKDGHRFLILDRRPRATEGAADFFLRFLAAERLSDEKSLTRAFHRSAISGIAQATAAGLLTAPQGATLRSAVTGALKSATVKLNEVVDNQVISPAAKTFLREHLESHKVDPEFEVDQTVAQELVKRIRFRGDHNLKLEVDTEHYNEMVTVTPEDDPAKGRRYKVVLLTSRWDEVPR